METMLLCNAAGKMYEASLISAVCMLAREWNSMPLQMIANCYCHCDFVRTTVKAMCGVDKCADDDCFEDSLSEGVCFEDYINIHVGMAVAGPLTADEIVVSVLDDSGDEALDGNAACEQLSRVPRCTVKEPVVAVIILKQFCLEIANSVRAMGCLTEVRRIVAGAQLSRQKQVTIRQLLSQ